MHRKTSVAFTICFLINIVAANETSGWVVGYSGKAPDGYSDLIKARDSREAVDVAKKHGYEVYQRNESVVILAPDVLNLKGLQIRSAWLERLKKNGQASYILFEGEDLNSPEVRDAIKCFKENLEFRTQETNPNLRFAMYAGKDLVLNDGNKTFALSLSDVNPVVRDKKKVAFDADSKLLERKAKPGVERSALDLASLPLNELSISFHPIDGRLSSRTKLLEELCSVIKEQLEPYQKMLDSADELLNWLFSDPKAMASTNVAPGTNFNDMPKEMQDRISGEIGKNPKAYGLQDASDVQGYLRKLKLNSVQTNCFVFSWMKMPNGSYKGMGYQIHLGN